MSQLAFIAELLHDAPHAVLMGDFNCTRDRPEMSLLYQRTRLQPPQHDVLTFPSWRPQRAIDHILMTDTLDCHGVRAMPAALSDHLALSIELDVPRARACVEACPAKENGRRFASPPVRVAGTGCDQNLVCTHVPEAATAGRRCDAS